MQTIYYILVSNVPKTQQEIEKRLANYINTELFDQAQYPVIEQFKKELNQLIKGDIAKFYQVKDQAQFRNTVYFVLKIIRNSMLSLHTQDEHQGNPLIKWTNLAASIGAYIHNIQNHLEMILIAMRNQNQSQVTLWIFMLIMINILKILIQVVNFLIYLYPLASLIVNS